MPYTDHKYFLPDGSRRLVDEVRDLMRASGMTQVELSQTFDVSLTFIQTLYRDKSCPSADVMQRIYEGLAGAPLLPHKSARRAMERPGGLEQAPAI